jgi:putative transposase
MGVSTADHCRRHGVGSAACCEWKVRFGGMEVSEARRLKAPADENARLKRLLGDVMLDNAMRRDVAAKNGSARRKEGGFG